MSTLESVDTSKFLNGNNYKSLPVSELLYTISDYLLVEDYKTQLYIEILFDIIKSNRIHDEQVADFISFYKTKVFLYQKTYYKEQAVILHGMIKKYLFIRLCDMYLQANGEG